MIPRGQLVVMGGAYTAVVALAVAVMDDPPAVMVFAVAFAWFSIGRAWDRLPATPPKSKHRWGRQ